MKAKIVLSVIISTVLLLAPCAFAQGAGQDPDALVKKFQNALERNGFDVTPGGVAAARGQHPASSQVRVAEPIPDPFTEALVRDLTASGFQVSQGVPKLYGFQDCIDHTYPMLKNCFLANPAAPYVVPVVKTWPDEYVDPAMVNAFVETDPGYSASYRLDPREAIVMFGLMPPPGRYMGLQTLEFSQPGKWKPKDYNHWANTPDLIFPIQYLFDTIPPGDPKSHRVITTSALGDLVNNVVMERQSGYPFGETRYFIITPSATTDEAVRRALQAQGVRTPTSLRSKFPGKMISVLSGRSEWARMPSTSSRCSATPSPMTRMPPKSGELISRLRCCACVPLPPWDLCNATRR